MTAREDQAQSIVRHGIVLPAIRRVLWRVQQDCLCVAILA
jgi:hypothetical protein